MNVATRRIDVDELVLSEGQISHDQSKVICSWGLHSSEHLSLAVFT